MIQNYINWHFKELIKPDDFINLLNQFEHVSISVQTLVFTYLQIHNKYIRKALYRAHIFLSIDF